LYQALKETVKIVEKEDFETFYKNALVSSIDEKANKFYSRMLSHAGIKKKPQGYNIGLNEGEAAGRTIHHLHIHIIPRYYGDIPDPRGGIRNIIPELGKY